MVRVSVTVRVRILKARRTELHVALMVKKNDL